MGHVRCCWERGDPERQRLWKDYRFSSVCYQVRSGPKGRWRLITELTELNGSLLKFHIMTSLLLVQVQPASFGKRL